MGVVTLLLAFFYPRVQPPIWFFLSCLHLPWNLTATLTPDSLDLEPITDPADNAGTEDLDTLPRPEGDSSNVYSAS